LKSCCVLQDHYDDERDKPVFNNATPDLQDQESKTNFIGLRPVLSKDRQSQTACNNDDDDDVQVQMVKSNGEIIYFNNPKLMALPSANTFAVSGHTEIRSESSALFFLCLLCLAGMGPSDQDAKCQDQGQDTNPQDEGQDQDINSQDQDTNPQDQDQDAKCQDQDVNSQDQDQDTNPQDQDAKCQDQGQDYLKTLSHKNKDKPLTLNKTKAKTPNVKTKTKTLTLKTKTLTLKTKTSPFKTKTLKSKSKTKGSKNLPRGDLEMRRCLEASHHQCLPYIALFSW